MVNFSKHPVIKGAVRATIRAIGPIVHALRLSGLFRMLEIGFAMILGKGAGAVDRIEWEVDAAARMIQRPDPVLVDLGANMGEWSRLMLDRFPDSEQLVMVEPMPELAQGLREMPFDRKHVVQSAIGQEPATSQFYYYPRVTGISSLHMRKELDFDENEVLVRDVEVTTIDHIVDALKLPRIDFMKMDLEGHELFALRGARAAFEKKLIKAVAFEIGTSNVNSRTFFRDMWDFFSEFGFRLYRIVPGGRLAAVSHYSEDLEYFKYFTNYVAVAPE
jgi:FkbM family methyltransferase